MAADLRCRSPTKGQAMGITAKGSRLGDHRQGSFRRERIRFRHWCAIRGRTRVRAHARTATMGA
ncbi:hypothetical protein TPA0905_11180 [Streptomyces olivaceus]|nr:hypothetical protein TPA0905_11180 [Streptomyces olivaceus]